MLDTEKGFFGLIVYLMKISALEERKECKVPDFVSTFAKEITLIFEVTLLFNID